jgi:hypothetical protein
LEQKAILEQHGNEILKIHVEKDELEDIRKSLLQLHQEKMEQENSQRDHIHALLSKENLIQ